MLGAGVEPPWSGYLPGIQVLSEFVLLCGFCQREDSGLKGEINLSWVPHTPTGDTHLLQAYQRGGSLKHSG